MSAGVGLLRGRATGSQWGSLAVGMLLYIVINSAGYFAERREWVMVAMFGVLLVVAIAAAATLIGGTSAGRTPPGRTSPGSTPPD